MKNGEKRRMRTGKTEKWKKKNENGEDLENGGRRRKIMRTTRQSEERGKNGFFSLPSRKTEERRMKKMIENWEELMKNAG